jgi:hypothetical protein
MKIIAIKGNKGRFQDFYGGFIVAEGFIFHRKAPKKERKKKGARSCFLPLLIQTQFLIMR